IKLGFFVKRTRRTEQKLTRFGVFHRDNYICQYCGKAEKQLTIDHIVPRSRGGEHTWENTTTACIPCNLHKAGRTPEQAHMTLLSKPRIPRNNLPFYLPHRYVNHIKEWNKYLEPYDVG
ncbi:MAG: HNH endonuclease, partial [Dehalococcoidales bacterium]